MFKRLVSNLPFNPSLINQVSFYAKRMHHEQAVRKIGLVFIILAMFVQIFAVVSPPEPTLAESPNDIIRGGFTTREQAVNYCRSNTQDFANILAHYQVTCEALAKANTATIKSTDHNKQLDSLGRVAQGEVIDRTGKRTEEYPVTIGNKKYFMKNLWAWDSGSSSSYKVLVVTNASGGTIKIMYNCGNIVTIGQYKPPTPPKPPAPPTPTPKPPEVIDVCPKIPNKQTNTAECDVCPNIPEEQSDKSECYPCPKAKEDSTTTACLELTKTASNQTQNIQNANGTVANNKDVIVYTLSVKNTGSQIVKAFVMEEDLSDVLEYATVTDLDGGEIDEANTVRWAKTDVAANRVLEKKITVIVKDPVPQTPASASDPASFDLTMTNVFYGTTVRIRLPASITKSSEQLVQTLPNTGPGAGLAVVFATTVFVSYFFARSRLLAKELDVIRTDFASTGGMS